MPCSASNPICTELNRSYHFWTSSLLDVSLFDRLEAILYCRQPALSAVGAVVVKEAPFPLPPTGSDGGPPLNFSCSFLGKYFCQEFNSLFCNISRKVTYGF